MKPFEYTGRTLRIGCGSWVVVVQAPSVPLALIGATFTVRTTAPELSRPPTRYMNPLTATAPLPERPEGSAVVVDHGPSCEDPLAATVKVIGKSLVVGLPAMSWQRTWKA